jgi:hypothetical protein
MRYPGGQQEVRVEIAGVADEGLEHHLRVRRQAGNLLDPDVLWLAADELRLRLAHVQFVAQRDGEKDLAGRKLGVVKLYGPPVVSPEPLVPTALPLIKVNCIGAASFPFDRAW